MAQVNENIRYEPDERCPLPIAIGVGFQFIMVALVTMVVVPVVVVRGGGEAEGYLTWILFAGLAVNGVTTVIQTFRVWRFGAGHVLIMGPSTSVVPVCIAALSGGGPAMMASLTVVSALFQFVLVARLSLLRRIITPVVSGSVLMMTAFVVMEAIFDMAVDVPDGISPSAAPVIATVTLAAVVALTLRAPRALQQWIPLITIAIGWAVAAGFGLYDFQSVIDAPWFGIPNTADWPGFHLTPDTQFLSLLPVFLLITLSDAIKSIGDGVAIQQVSRHRPRATDFRAVQGAVNVEGLGNLLCGLAGTIASTVYPSSVGSASLTGNAARIVGVYAGIILVAIALLPKALALLLTIPHPVAAGYMIAIFGLIFIEGVRTVAQDGLDTRKAIIAGVAFWICVGFQNHWIFPDLLENGIWGTLLGNGLASGSLAAILMTMFVNLTSERRRRLNTKLELEAVPEIDAFLREFAAKIGWNQASTERLCSVGEEALSSLLTHDDEQEAEDSQRLRISVQHTADETIEMEFITTSDEENLQDKLAYLHEQPEILDEREISFHLLRHYASSVQHRKYHNIDIITVQVEGFH